MQSLGFVVDGQDIPAKLPQEMRCCAGCVGADVVVEKEHFSLSKPGRFLWMVSFRCSNGEWCTFITVLLSMNSEEECQVRPKMPSSITSPLLRVTRWHHHHDKTWVHHFTRHRRQHQRRGNIHPPLKFKTLQSS